MPVWQEPLNEDLQKQFLVKAVQALHEAGLNNAVELLLNSLMVISEREYEDKIRLLRKALYNA